MPEAFQSTSLSRGKTAFLAYFMILRSLSIHFPLTREDKNAPCLMHSLRSFNPLPSHEGRPLSRSGKSIKKSSFNPLPSHEGRQNYFGYNPLPAVFQSTSLSRGKTAATAIPYDDFGLSIHFPLTREDISRSTSCRITLLSIHFPLTREDRSVTRPFHGEPSFQSTSLSRGKTTHS